MLFSHDSYIVLFVTVNLFESSVCDEEGILSEFPLTSICQTTGVSSLKVKSSFSSLHSRLQTVPDRIHNTKNLVRFPVKSDYRCNKDITDDPVENYCLTLIPESAHRSFVICCTTLLPICAPSVPEIVSNATI